MSTISSLANCLRKAWTATSSNILPSLITLLRSRPSNLSLRSIVSLFTSVPTHAGPCVQKLTGGPVEIQASASGTGLGGNGTTITFDPLLANQRPGLVLKSGVVYIGWAGHRDGGPAHGWLVAYSAGT